MSNIKVTVEIPNEMPPIAGIVALLNLAAATTVHYGYDTGDAIRAFQRALDNALQGNLNMEDNGASKE